MPDNKILTVFVLATAIILYCAFATLIQPTSAQRIEKEFGVRVVKFR